MNEQRLTWLKIAAALAVAVFVLDNMVIRPTVERWRAQTARLEALRREVQEGRALLAREEILRARWSEMLRRDLPEDGAEAENEMFKAVARWGRAGGLTFTGLNPQWRIYEEGYVTLECRAAATGDQAGVGRFLAELETDPLAVRLESFELAAIDEQGRRLNLTARFSALRIESNTGRMP